jgi:hypothetical protein
MQGLAMGVMALDRRLGRFNLVDIWRSLLDQAPRRLKAPEGAGMAGSEGDEGEVLEGLEKFKGLAPGPLMALNLGAGGKLRRYPPAAAAAALAMAEKEIGGKIALLGTRRERALTLAFESRWKEAGGKAPILNLSGKTSLRGLCSVLKEADLLVTSDTGTAHLGAAAGAKVLAMFWGPSFAHETAPYSDNVWALQGLSPCGPCNNGLGCQRPVCRGLPDPSHVKEAVLAALKGDEGGAKGPGKAGPAPQPVELWRGGVGEKLFSLTPAGPFRAVLDDTALFALVLREAWKSMDFWQGHAPERLKLDLGELRKYMRPRQPFQYSTILSGIRFVSKKGLPDVKERKEFRDLANSILIVFKMYHEKLFV